MVNLDRLQTPPGDGDTLIEPAVSHWRRLLEDNLRRQEHQAVALAGVPVETARQLTRSALFGPDCNKPAITSGHQPTYVHPGVWAKQVVVRYVAGRLGLKGAEFVVDNDAPAASALQVPVLGADGLVRTKDVALVRGPAGSAYEGRPPVDRPTIHAIRSELSVTLPECLADSVIQSYLDELAAAGDPCDAVEQHLIARRRIDASLSAELGRVRVSRVFGGPFVADLLLSPDRFARAYNESLIEYRSARGIRSPAHPLPDLGREPDRTETALWIYQPLRRRRRLWVRRRGDRICCYADRERVATLAPEDLARDADAVLAQLRPWVIRPRALTLTLWLRLLACDLFVHGIGGAKYDRITDGIFRRYYGCEPPAYACVTATLRLPLPRKPAAPGDLAVARLRFRDLRYNPDRYLPDAPVGLLSERKRLIHRSGRLRERRGPRLARWETFVAIRQVNARLVECHPEIEQQLARRVEHLHRQVRSNRIAGSREYFYALQPHDRLAMLAARLVEDTGLPD